MTFQTDKLLLFDTRQSRCHQSCHHQRRRAVFQNDRTAINQRSRKVKLYVIRFERLVVHELFAILILSCLSANILVGFTPKSLPIPTSRIMRRSHTAALLAKHSLTHSDYADQSAMILCCFELQLMAALAKRNMQPEVDFLINFSPSQSESPTPSTSNLPPDL
jgi:hypothetical protein